MVEKEFHPMTQKVRDNLWNNPPVPRESLSEEQQETYRKNGEWMYGCMDFENLEHSSKEAVAYIVVQLKSGLHPSYLSPEERTVMENVFGKNWEEQYATYTHF